MDYGDKLQEPEKSKDGILLLSVTENSKHLFIDRSNLSYEMLIENNIPLRPNIPIDLNVLGVAELQNVYIATVWVRDHVGDLWYAYSTLNAKFNANGYRVLSIATEDDVASRLNIAFCFDYDCTSNMVSMVTHPIYQIQYAVDLSVGPSSVNITDTDGSEECSDSDTVEPSLIVTDTIVDRMLRTDLSIVGFNIGVVS
jgi:hypothetical protein